jgi:hypothetical protein
MKIDHVVVLTKDLDRATHDWANDGFTVTPGGVHAGGLTHNALMCLADGSYVELLAFRDSVSSDPHHRWHRYRDFPGVIDYALAVDDLDEFADSISHAGLHYTDVKEGGRQRPDGVALRWRSSFPNDQKRGLPFLIEDVTPRDLRVPAGDATQHPNGARSISHLRVIAPDIEQAEREFSALFGGLIGADERSRQFEAGHAILHVSEPAPDTDDSKLLYERGSGLVELTMSCADGSSIVRH